MSGFVGSRVVETKAEVLEIIQRLEAFSPYYFLCWPHKISGILTQAQFTEEILPSLPNDLSPEGQVFTQAWDLRWECRSRRLAGNSAQYHLLLLGNTEAEAKIPGFTALAENQCPIPWKTKDYPAVIHQEQSSEGTRFPKGFRVPRGFKADSLKQRHFIHETTGITQFVALVSPP